MIKEHYVPIIKDEAVKLRKIYNYDENAVIGDYIFSILQNECIVIKSPEEKLRDVDNKLPKIGKIRRREKRSC